jgi:hypothetical protein
MKPVVAVDAAIVIHRKAAQLNFLLVSVETKSVPGLGLFIIIAVFLSVRVVCLTSSARGTRVRGA